MNTKRHKLVLAIDLPDHYTPADIERLLTYALATKGPATRLTIEPFNDAYKREKQRRASGAGRAQPHHLPAR